MIVTNRGSVFRLLRWQWRRTLQYTLWGVFAAALHQAGLTWLELPGLPLAVVGAALGIFVSFRTNSAYDRWWEGRKLWGRMINSSRHWATQVIAYARPGDEAKLTDTQVRLVRRHIAYVHTLRTLLRQQNPLEDENVLRYIDRDHDVLGRESNLTHALLQRQMDDIVALNEQGVIDHFRLQSMDRTLMAFLDIQGGCERIKKTPLPRGYGFIAERLVAYYAVLFPFAVVGLLGWVAIPINVLVCLAFALINETGRVLEDPFTLFWNALPLSALSRTIEVNLLQRVDETDLPPLLKPDENGILM